MKYKENLNIILMRDKGPRRSFRVVRGRFFLLVAFLVCQPLISAVLCWQSWHLWQKNRALSSSMEQLQASCQMAEARAQRLENLQALLDENNVTDKGILMRRLGNTTFAGSHTSRNPIPESDDNPENDDFPALDSGYVKVMNVQARIVGNNRLRLALDLHNTEKQDSATGMVLVTLLTADGQKNNLAFEPADAANFRINRFKRAVTVLTLPRHLDLFNARLIVEVQNQEMDIVYRNIFPVGQ